MWLCAVDINWVLCTIQGKCTVGTFLGLSVSSVYVSLWKLLIQSVVQRLTSAAHFMVVIFRLQYLRGGSVAMDHHSIQLSVYLWFSNKGLPVPVCLAPQIHNLHSQSALLFLFLFSSFTAKIWPPHPSSVYDIRRKIYFSWDRESCVSWQMHVNQQEQIN